MAILQSVDGKFYEVDDKALADNELDMEQVKELLGDTPAPPPPGMPLSGPLPFEEPAPRVVINVYGGGEPFIDMPPPPPPGDESYDESRPEEEEGETA